MFNSREYEWADVSIMLGGRNLVRVVGIQYTEAMEKEVIYAKGRYGHSIQRGNHSLSGQIILLQSELLALQAATPFNSILNMHLDCLISYGGNLEGKAGMIKTDLVYGLEFTEVPKEINQNDKMMQITLPFIALRVINNYI